MAQIELEPLPHRSAIEYFRSKGYAHQLQRFHHLDHFREEHARNWVVAKAMRDDISQAIRAEFDRAFSEGRTLDQFQADLAPRLQEMGWWGKSMMEDPVTGEMEEVQLGSMNRLRVIFDTNMRTAHAAGHWASIQRTKRAFPYLQYIQIERPTKRHDHARFHNKIWGVDDPIWLRIYPPNGYFCGCTVIQRTEGWMKRNGRVVDDPIDLDEEEWTHKRSGEVHMIPRGITPGFDTNPGAVWLDTTDDWEGMTPDLSSERRATERGLIEGLRLRRLSDDRDTMIVTDTNSQPVDYFAAPADVLLDPRRVPDQASFLYSRAADQNLSRSDLARLSDLDGSAATAIGSAGSIWRAVRTGDANLQPLLASFESGWPEFAGELQATGNQTDILSHARLLWLEEMGAVSYSWRMTERMRQIMDANADLIERLVYGRP